jgi:hypothetical protein
MQAKSGVQEFRSSGVQEFRSSGVQAVEEYKIARGKRALPFGLNRSPALSIWAPELPNSCNS